MTEYKMRMHDEHFQKIKNGIKNVELRLNDKKRQRMKVGDKLVFVSRKDGEKIFSEIVRFYKDKNFSKLLDKMDILKTGHNDKGGGFAIFRGILFGRKAKRIWGFGD